MAPCKVAELTLNQDNERRVVRTLPAPLRKLGKELMVDFHAMDASSHSLKLNCHTLHVEESRKTINTNYSTKDCVQPSAL